MFEGQTLFADTISPLQTLTRAERERLERVEGVVFDVQRYSVHDGPGLRTNVFLKGCPLRCQWCANPESQNSQPEPALSTDKCINCGQFEEACPICWANYNGSDWTTEQRAEFEARAAVCPTGAIHWIGERRTAGDVLREVLRDTPFYQDGGGVTLTGGEPTAQPAMAEALLRLAKAEGITTAMETCGHVPWEVLERLLAHLDHVLFDIKHLDSETHRAFTGLGNELILSNFRRLVAGSAPVTVRVPLIPGFNASADSVRAIAEFVLELKGTTQVDLLPYHTLGKSKYRTLGREYLWEDHHRLTDSEVDALAEVVVSCGLRVNVGG